MERKELMAILEQDIGRVHKDVAELTRRLRMKHIEVMMLLTHREIVLLNIQAARILEELGKRKGKV